MGIRTTSSENKVAIFDSVSGFAFGPTFDSASEADDFLDFAAENLPHDLRVYGNDKLEDYVTSWRIARGEVEV